MIFVRGFFFGTNNGKLIRAKYEKSDQYSALAHVK